MFCTKIHSIPFCIPKQQYSPPHFLYVVIFLGVLKRVLASLGSSACLSQSISNSSLTDSLDQWFLIAHAAIFWPRGIWWRRFIESLSESLKGDNSDLNDSESELEDDPEFEFGSEKLTANGVTIPLILTTESFNAII